MGTCQAVETETAKLRESEARTANLDFLLEQGKKKLLETERNHQDHIHELTQVLGEFCIYLSGNMYIRGW